jgi:hypothetical protein
MPCLTSISSVRNRWTNICGWPSATSWRGSRALRFCFLKAGEGKGRAEAADEGQPRAGGAEIRQAAGDLWKRELAGACGVDVAVSHGSRSAEVRNRDHIWRAHRRRSRDPARGGAFRVTAASESGPRAA